MVILSTGFRRATGTYQLYKHRSLFLSPCRFKESDASSSDKSTPTKIVKSFTEMPSSFLRLDGSVSPPLNEWWGGLSHEFPGRGRDNLDSPLCRQPIDNLGQDSKPRRARTQKPPRKVSPNIDNEVLNTEVCRTKRKTRPASQVSGISTLDGDSTPELGSYSPAGLPKAQRKRAVRPAKLSPDPVGEGEGGWPRNGLAKEILENLNKFPHCLLLTKVGQFYESYFDQAKDIAHLLNIKLTTRKWDGRRIPMCGFPLLHLDKYLKIMVQQNKRFVAMCEEFPRHSASGIKDIERRVVRVVTPGTLIDEPFLNPYENNYLLAIGTSEDPMVTESRALGLAWIDVSTGEFFSKVSNYDHLRDELARIGPREVVLDHRMKSHHSNPIFQALAEEENFVTFTSPIPPETNDKMPVNSEKLYTSGRWKTNATPATTSVLPTNLETHAIDLLTNYLRTNLLEHMPDLSTPKQDGFDAPMQIDSHTIKALEIRECIREGSTKGSLLSVLNRTVSSGGTRLLARWLCSPSTSVDEINARQSLVAFLFARPHFRADIIRLMVDIDDIGRIVQKLVLGRGDSADLLSVNKTIQAWYAIVDRVSQERVMERLERGGSNLDDWASIDHLISRMTDVRALSQRITMALEDDSGIKDVVQGINEAVADMEEPNQGVVANSGDLGVVWRGQNKWGVKPQFSPKILDLHNTLRNLVHERNQLEKDLQLKFDAPSLTLRASPAQGMHVHLAKAKRDKSKINAASEFIIIAESGSTRCYFHKEWSQLGGKIAEVTMALAAAEREAFEVLRSETNSHASTLRCNSQVLDELDVALSFANVATEMNFVRPTITEETLYDVTNGRHPTVELGLLSTGRVFTPNTLRISQTSKLHVITGPNMAGKSTLLRQTAITAILAQIGSFVPADSAVIGIVDKLFSRVGAKDDLFHDRSTFMVEMLETAEILHRATPKSLVIMDEVGRGTTINDGVAIAYATLHHLVTKNQCRALFATHFHELADMVGYPHNQHNGGIFQTVGFSCTGVDETEDGFFAYSYRVQPGVNRDSHGLKVAQLAGLPSETLKVAEEALSRIRDQGW